MRTIKFRAWIKRENKMKPVKGLSFDYCEETGYKGEEIGLVIGTPYIDELSIERPKHLEVANHHPAVDTAILMQFTGLLDKNEKEIYEGDIVTVNENLGGTVIFDDAEFSVDLKSSVENATIANMALNCFESIEVIGNIYENPEILTHSTQQAD